MMSPIATKVPNFTESKEVGSTVFNIFEDQKFRSMSNQTEGKIQNLIVVGDRVLIKPKKFSNKTKAGLYLPPGYQEKEEIQTGFVVKCGLGYPIPVQAEDEGEPWKHSDENIRYIPLQAKKGDLAIFLQKGAIEIMFNDEKYFRYRRLGIPFFGTFEPWNREKFSVV